MARVAKSISVSIMPETLIVLEQLAKANHSTRSKYITDLIWDAAKGVQADEKSGIATTKKQ